jgi:hypothetical protein
MRLGLYLSLSLCSAFQPVRACLSIGLTNFPTAALASRFFVCLSHPSECAFEWCCELDFAAVFTTAVNNLYILALNDMLADHHETNRMKKKQC